MQKYVLVAAFQLLIVSNFFLNCLVYIELSCYVNARNCERETAGTFILNVAGTLNFKERIKLCSASRG